MPRSSGSWSPSAATDADVVYRLRTPPVRHLGVPIGVVLRGHRISVPFGYRSRYHAVGIPQSSPTPTEPCSSPLPLDFFKDGLPRTYAVRGPSEGNKLVSLCSQPTITEHAVHALVRTSPGPRKPSIPDPFYIGTPFTDFSNAPRGCRTPASSPVCLSTSRLSWSIYLTVF